MLGDNMVAVIDAEPTDMAKKKAAKDKPKQGVVFSLKAAPDEVEEVKAWLSELAMHVGAPVSVTVHMALKQFAVAQKFPKPMPKRLAR